MAMMRKSALFAVGSLSGTTWVFFLLYLYYYGLLLPYTRRPFLQMRWLGLHGYPPLRHLRCFHYLITEAPM
jgi:hypothetical protein